LKVSKLLFIFIIAGIVSSIAVVNFYFIQKEFTQKQREFLININNLENSFIDITNLILKNSIYVYINQDNIAIANKKLKQNYKKLQNSKVLLDSSYVDVKDNVNYLQKCMKENLQNIDIFLRINAGVKNSLLFLSRHIDNGKILEDYSQKELLKARIILKHFNDAKKLQDLVYLSKNDYLLKSDSKDKAVQQYISTFNLHTTFLMKNYPPFIEVTKKILENQATHQRIHIIKKRFSQISLHDVKALDEFATILFILFFLSFVTIIVLLLKYQRENKKLQDTYISLEHSHTYDQLTELYNRRKFELDIEDVTKFKNPSLMIMNINDFRYINDIYGNDIGNILLKEISKFIKDKIKVSYKSSIYRIDGDEFGIVFDEISESRILKISNDLENSIVKHTFIINNIKIELRVNIAINNIKPLLENADLALKQIKKSNKSNVCVFNESQHLKQNVEENMKTVQIIKEAILDGRIVPFFQPIVNLQTSKIEKYEALVRLKLDNGEILPPFRFLEIAQKSSQYHEITKIMIEKTILTAISHPQYRFSVNMSMQDILDKKITDMLFDLLEKYKNTNAKIDIELLESEHLDNMNVVKKFINKLHTYGSFILIDDFGTGYSNFSYFSELDIDIVKIDGSIVKEIVTSKRKFHMLKSIKEFANGMDMKTVSEFVESREIALKLKSIGSTYAQGYYFSEPLEQPLDDANVTI